MRVGAFSFSVRAKMLVHETSRITLSKMEADILLALMVASPRVVSFQELRGTLDRPPTSRRALAVHICALRQKVESYPRWPYHLKTIRGRGYLFRG